MEVTNKEFTTCPCCGKETFPINTELDSKIIDLFMSCVLSQEPFQYTYELFNGKVLVTCKEPSATEQAKVSKLGLKLSNVQDEELRTQINVMLIRMAAIYPIVQIVIQTNGQKKIYAVQQLCIQLQDKLLAAQTVDKDLIHECLDRLNDVKNTSSIPMTILNKVLDTHSNISNLLTIAGFDTAFYKGIPHV